MRAPLFGVVHGLMLWNLFLAGVPAALAVVLFRRHASRNPAWWILFGAWVLFLPNAPYVLTDVTHLVDDVRNAHSKVHAYAVLVAFGAFFAAGLAAYVFSLQRFRRFLHRTVPARAVAPILFALHGLCVVAMYVGRFIRLNSWDAVVAPASVLHAVVRVPRPTTVALLAVMFVVVGVASYVTKMVGDQALVRLRRLR